MFITVWLIVALLAIGALAALPIYWTTGDRPLRRMVLRVTGTEYFMTGRKMRYLAVYCHQPGSAALPWKPEQGKKVNTPTVLEVVIGCWDRDGHFTTRRLWHVVGCSWKLYRSSCKLEDMVSRNSVTLQHLSPEDDQDATAFIAEVCQIIVHPNFDSWSAEQLGLVLEVLNDKSSEMSPRCQMAVEYLNRLANGVYCLPFESYAKQEDRFAAEFIESPQANSSSA